MLEDASELGCVKEDDVLQGKLSFHDFERLEQSDERFILLAMHQTLLERGLCAREVTEDGNVLVFPSFFKRNRPELSGHPAILVSYIFDGFITDIYSTLVVRLHHTKPFEHEKLWRDAADFKTSDALLLGFKLTREAGGSGKLEVYCDPAVQLWEKIVFIKFVHEHIKQRATSVQRFRHYVCGKCKNPLLDFGAIARRGDRGATDIGCPSCDERILLQDEIEEMYVSKNTIQKVQLLDESVEVELDNESKERALVGEVVSAVALAGQLCREKAVSDHGIDAEIEFKDDNHAASGSLIFLQLKSGDSHLRRNKDGAEIFTIKDGRHARYWWSQNVPVMLVIRSSSGEIRWMEIRQYLRDRVDERKKEHRSKLSEPEAIGHIVFKGEPFNTTTILRWRNRLLANRNR